MERARAESGSEIVVGIIACFSVLVRFTQRTMPYARANDFASGMTLCTEGIVYCLHPVTWQPANELLPCRNVTPEADLPRGALGLRIRNHRNIFPAEATVLELT